MNFGNFDTRKKRVDKSLALEWTGMLPWYTKRKNV